MSDAVVVRRLRALHGLAARETFEQHVHAISLPVFLYLFNIAEPGGLAAWNVAVVGAPIALFFDMLHSLFEREGLVTFAALEHERIESVDHETIHLLGGRVDLSAVGTVMRLFQPTLDAVRACQQVTILTLLRVNADHVHAD